MSEPEPVRAFQVGTLEVLVYENRSDLGRAAAAAIADELGKLASEEIGSIGVVFAAAPSQNETLAALATRGGIDWSRVIGFHMDEYLGLGPEHPASFRRYLNEHLFRFIGLSDEHLRLIPGEQTDRPSRVCLAYEDALYTNPPKLVCCGIGENGHLAFNDPPVADFHDPVRVKVVKLDKMCREQQLHDGCFESLEDVPTHAYTLTIPALTAAPRVIAVVPGARKAEAALATLRGPVHESCPASILREHPHASLYLDRDSAKLVV